MTDPFGILPQMEAGAIEARQRVNERIAADPTLGPDGQRWFDDPALQAAAKADFLAGQLPPGWRREGTSLISPNGIAEADLSQVTTHPISERVGGWAAGAKKGQWASAPTPHPRQFSPECPKDM